MIAGDAIATHAIGMPGAEFVPGGSGGPVVGDGLEFTLPERLFGFTLPERLIHYTLVDDND